ncbi:hypothetical protein HMPREF0742_00869 [Rothia aeria F0184]|uniref:Uncharacterized protein n=1 Tax=Rothia aeria F0184 TaxID=888019 RepID=U7V4I8_9MICC|nr:hypothetical protein HMPREF0742_00869 [Rothia aeria F0184]
MERQNRKYVRYVRTNQKQLEEGARAGHQQQLKVPLQGMFPQ